MYTPLSAPPGAFDLSTAVRRIGGTTQVRVALVGTATVTLHGWTTAGWSVIVAGISSPGVYMYSLDAAYGAVHLEVTSGTITSAVLRWQVIGASSSAVSSASPLVGDGSSGSPLRFATDGVTAGQVIKYSGGVWGAGDVAGAGALVFQTFIATEGQVAFVITDSATVSVFEDVAAGGGPVSEWTGDIDTKMVTLAEGVPSGMEVTIQYRE